MLRGFLLRSERASALVRVEASQRLETVKKPRRRVSWLRVDRVFGELGIRRDDAAGRKLFAETMEERRGTDKPEEWKAVRRGWFLGGVQLRERVLEMMDSGVGEHHGGEAKRETVSRRRGAWLWKSYRSAGGRSRI